MKRLFDAAHARAHEPDLAVTTMATRVVVRADARACAAPRVPERERLCPPSPRFVALDRLRAWAVLMMIQGHTFSALLAEGALPKRVMQLHGLLHGLTAPAFLFGAGLAFGVATYPRYAQHRALGNALWRRLGRYALLFAIGYALQLPGASLRAVLRLQGDALLPVLRVGPLQLIAACLALCQLAALVLSPRNHARAALALGLAIMIAAPSVWSASSLSALGPLLTPWLDGRTGSLFPLFPWASFAFFGVAAAGAITLRGTPSARTWLALGAPLALLSYAAFLAGVRLSPTACFWQASPLNVLFRLGVVASLLGALHWPHGATRTRVGPFARHSLAASTLRPFAPDHLASFVHRGLVNRSARALASALDRVGAFFAQHSLACYVAHLLLLYGTPLTPSPYRYFGRALSAPQAVLAFALVLTLTVLATHAHNWLLAQRERAWIQLAFTVALALVLVR